MSSLQTHCHSKLDFPKLDHDTGGTKRRKDNQLQSLLIIFVENLNMA